MVSSTRLFELVRPIPVFLHFYFLFVEKLFSNLGDMLNSVKIAAKTPEKSTENSLFNFKKDFKI
jgi:hypothetical protein